MYRSVRLLLSGPLLSLLVILPGCQTVSEGELAQKVKESESPAEQIVAARDYLSEFPNGAHRSEVARAFFNAAIEAGDEDAISAAASAYVDDRAGTRLNAARNFIAWTLAGKGLALDVAERYGRALVEDARKEKSDSLSSYLDTLAYVLYRKGDAQEAVQLQKEATAGEAQDPEMLSRLALYQHASGSNLEALQTAASAILKGADGEIVARFPTWLNDDGDAEEMARQIVEPAVADYLMANDVPIARGRAALLLALGNIDLGRAESMARTALEELRSKDAREAVSNVEIDLAQVLCARGDYAGAVDLLEPQKSDRMPWDALYWYTLGHAYRLSDRPEQATKALLQPLLVEDNDLVMADLRELDLSDDAIAQRVKSEKEELENFDPGQYQGPLPDSGRTVLLELFTGAECNPCQSADLAVDLMSEYFPKKVLAILEYHVHIPGADPLTTPDSEARFDYYDVSGTPTVLLDGQELPSGGGPRILKKSLFEGYRAKVEKLWGETPKVDLDASARRHGPKIDVMVRVTPANRSGAAPQGIVRIALVEKSVDYTGGNGIDRQSFVVRDLSDVDENGARLDEGRAFLNYSIDVKQVQERLSSYLAGFEKNPPERYKGFGGFREKPITLNPANLAVVVWVENREARSVLQSIYLPL